MRVIDGREDAWYNDIADARCSNFVNGFFNLFAIHRRDFAFAVKMPTTV